MNNYPAGVTGREYEIAGPDWEGTETKQVYCQWEDCPHFEKEVEVELDVQTYQGQWWATYTCPTCEKDSEFDGEIETVDPDYAWDNRDFD